MSSGLNIPRSGALDLVSVGALVHRLDPGILPFRKAQQCSIHVSGGEFNVAANLADCFGMKTGIATAMVDYPIGDLIAERVRAMGVQGFYRRFEHDGVRGPNMATVLLRPRPRRARPGGLLQPLQRGGGAPPARRLRLEGDLRRRRAVVPQRRHLRRALPDHRRGDRRGDEGGEGGGGGGVLRPQLPGEAVEDLRGGGPGGGDHEPHRRERGRARGQRGGPADGARACPGPRWRRRRSSTRAPSSP